MLLKCNADATACRSQAGKEWAYSFLKRNKNLSLRTPEPTSMARIAGFNRVQVNKFFDLMKEKFSKYPYRPDQIYNIDESGITTVQKPGKIIAKTGLKQVGIRCQCREGHDNYCLRNECTGNVHSTYDAFQAQKNERGINERLSFGCDRLRFCKGQCLVCQIYGTFHSVH